MDGDGTTWDYPSVRVEGAEVWYRASALGTCTKALAAARQELEPWKGATPENLQKAYDAGHAAEPKVYADLEQGGMWAVVSKQQEVRLDLTPRLHIIGHLDGMVVATGLGRENVQPRLLEIKRQNDDEFKGGSITDSMWWQKYQYQLSAYMVATNLPALIARVNDEGVIKYETWLEPPIDRGGLLTRVMEVERTARVDLRGVECDKDDFPCPYWKLLHPGRGADEVERLEVDDSELAGLIVHLKRANDDASAAEKAKKSLRDRVLEKVREKMATHPKLIVRDSGTGVAVKIVVSDTGQRIIPPGKMTRVTPILPDEHGDEGDGVDPG